MKDSIPMVTRAAFEAELIKKAWQDPDYKERLLKNPKAVIQEALGALIPNITLPQELTVTAHEESPQSVCINLPVNPADYADRLAELSGDPDSLAGPAADKTVDVMVNLPPVIGPLVIVTAPTVVNIGPINPVIYVVNIVA